MMSIGPCSRCRRWPSGRRRTWGPLMSAAEGREAAALVAVERAAGRLGFARVARSTPTPALSHPCGTGEGVGLPRPRVSVGEGRGEGASRLGFLRVVRRLTVGQAVLDAVGEPAEPGRVGVPRVGGQARAG